MPREDNSIDYYLYKALHTDYWDFNGRACKKEFWSVMMLQFFVGSIFTALHYFYFRFEDRFYIPFIFYMLAFVYTAITIVPTFTVHVRRLHDVGKTGWWHPAGVGFIFGIILGGLGIPIFFIYSLVVFFLYNGKPPINPELVNTLSDIAAYAILLLYSGSVLFGLGFLFMDAEKESNKWGEDPKKLLDSEGIESIRRK